MLMHPDDLAARLEVLVDTATVNRLIEAVAVETGRTPAEVRDRLRAWCRRQDQDAEAGR